MKLNRSHSHASQCRTLALFFFLACCSSLLLLSNTSVRAQGNSMVVLVPRPYIGDTLEAARLAESLRSELRLAGRYHIIPGPETPSTVCDEVACATEIAKSLGATRAVYGNIQTIGRERVWTFTLVDATTGTKVFSGDVIKPTIAEMHNEVPWAARSILAGHLELRPEQMEHRIEGSRYRQRDTLLFGVGIGQLYPLNGYYSRLLVSGDRDTLDRGFVLDFRISLYNESYLLTFQSSIRDAFVVDLGGTYFLTKGAIAPYLGGMAGFTFAVEDPSFGGEERTLSGFNIMPQAGIWFLRKRAIQAYINLDYMMTFNDRSDQALVLTIGLVAQTDAFGF